MQKKSRWDHIPTNFYKWISLFLFIVAGLNWFWGILGQIESHFRFFEGKQHGYHINTILNSMEKKSRWDHIPTNFYKWISFFLFIVAGLKWFWGILGQIESHFKFFEGKQHGYHINTILNSMEKKSRWDHIPTNFYKWISLFLFIVAGLIWIWGIFGEIGSHFRLFEGKQHGYHINTILNSMEKKSRWDHIPQTSINQ